MNRKIFRVFIALPVLLAAMSLVCQGQMCQRQTVFNCDGISYMVTGAAEVSVFSARNLVGAFTIPETVVYKGFTYTVTSIGEFAFEGDPEHPELNGLTSVTIPNCVTSIDKGSFAYCSSLASVAIGSGVTNIGSSAFLGCSSLTSVNIPEGVTCIDRVTFSGCSSLASITIPGSVTSIGYCAFVDCPGLTNITVEGQTPPDANNPFNGQCTIALQVPAGTESAYQAAEVWKAFSINGAGEIAAVEAIGNNPRAVIANGTLTVDSPVSERIGVYTVGGALLYRTRKDAGQATFDISRLPKGLLIVNGSSGWATKAVK